MPARTWCGRLVPMNCLPVNKGRQIAEMRGVNVNWIHGDVCSWSMPKYKFDLVAVLYMHTSAQEREQWLGNVIRAVKPSGTLIYIAHDADNIEHGIGGPQDSDLLPAVSDITRALQDFLIERAEVIERPVTGDPGHGKEQEGIALDAFIRAVRT